MDILGVTMTVHEGGIELADLESVKSALTVFGSGYSRASREALQYGFDGDSTGGVGLMLKTMIDTRQESSFMRELLNGVDGVTDESNYSRSYDYDGVGPFFKTRVTVGKANLTEGTYTYLLSLNAAYVGDKPCAGLAETLGADRALWRDEVRVETAPIRGRFEFDFDEIMERLAKTGLAVPSGEEVADTLTDKKRGYDDHPQIQIVSGGLVVSLGISTHTVSGPIDFRTREYVWEKDRAVISGPVSKYNSESNPQFAFSIAAPRNPEEPSWKSSPIIDPGLKQAVHDQASAIVTAFA